jgi:hypothetical protein
MLKVTHVLKIIGLIFGVLVTILFLLFLLFSFKVHRDTENRITTTLSAHYEPAHVEVKDRLDWKHAGSDWSYGGQICFLIAVRQPGDEAVRNTVAMVADGDDGGAFKFVREYPSMLLCKADFSRG